MPLIESVQLFIWVKRLKVKLFQVVCRTFLGSDRQFPNHFAKKTVVHFSHEGSLVSRPRPRAYQGHLTIAEPRRQCLKATKGKKSPHYVGSSGPSPDLHEQLAAGRPKESSRWLEDSQGAGIITVSYGIIQYHPVSKSSEGAELRGVLQGHGC